MKYLILSIIAFAVFTDPLTIRKINIAKEEARQAFIAGDYKGAIEKYKYLVDSLGVSEDEVNLNLANAYYHEKDTANATTTYQSLANSPKNEIASKAHQQLGIIAHQQGKLEQALNDFKLAVKADPANDQARYDYEMLKKKLDEKKKQDEKNQQNKDEKKDEKKQDQNKEQQKKDNKDNKDQKKQDQEKKDQEKKDQEKKDQEKKDSENKDQQNKEEQEKEEKEKKEQQQKQQQEQEKKQKENENKDLQNLDQNKLKEMKISEEKARMILEAMKNQEKQYLQQQKRKPTKSKDRNKPDW
jgi:Ca-activated chloride channel family protein